MNTYRRLLTVILITLSCLFAIQPAGAANAQAADDDGCSNIGPTLFNLGLGTTSTSAVAASVPACYSLESASTGGSGSLATVRVPIEGSLMVVDDTPAFVIAAANNAAAGSDDQDLLSGRPDQIGPTI